MFPPYFYFRFSRNRLFWRCEEQISASLRSSSRDLLGPTVIAFRPFWFQKTPRHISARPFQLRLSSVTNPPAPTFSPVPCPPRGLRHAALDSDHVENEKLSYIDSAFYGFCTLGYSGIKITQKIRNISKLVSNIISRNFHGF